MPEALAKALEIIHCLIAAHLAHPAAFMRKQAVIGAMTLVQRSDSALNSNIHRCLLCRDGVYTPRPHGALRFTRVTALDREELQEPVRRIAERVGRALERMGLQRSDAGGTWLDQPPSEDTDAVRQLIGSAVTYRIAVGLQAGRRPRRLRRRTRARAASGGRDSAGPCGESAGPCRRCPRPRP